MNEKEKNEIVSTVENDADLNDARDYRQVAIIRIQADIARQLTRIADVMEDKYRKEQSNTPSKDGD